MERTPVIQDEENQALSIEIVQEQISSQEVIPTYSYKFQDKQISEESRQMYQSFLEFLRVNEELIEDPATLSREDYVKGFQRAIAIFRLWMDSFYIGQ